MRRKAFTGPDREAKYLRSAMWLRAALYGSDQARDWCRANDVRVQRAATEGIDSAGAFLVPLELARAILDIRDEFGAFRRRARIEPMTSDNTHVARRPGGTVASFTQEGIAAAAATATFDQIQLTAKKLTALILLSNELEEDSVFEIVDTVANEAAWAFSVKEDGCAFNGDGTSTYAGMRGALQIALDGNHGMAKVTAASGHNTFLTLDQVDLSTIIAAVQAAAVPNAAWFVSQTCFAQAFARIATTGNGFIDRRVVDGIDTPFFMGFPVILTQVLPLISTTLTTLPMLAFGDMYLAGVLGQRRGLTIRRSEERYFDIDQIGVLVSERFCSVIHNMGDNVNRGALSVLVAP